MDHPWLAHYPEGIAWDIAIPGRTLPDLLHEAAACFPDRPAIHFLGYRCTYRELEAIVDRCAAGMHATGIRQGEHIGLLLPNCPVSIIAYYAILKLGAVVVNLSPLAAAEEIRHQLADAKVTHVITVNLALLYDKLSGSRNGSTPLQQIILSDFASWLPPVKRRLFRLLKRKEIVPRDPTHLSFESLLTCDQPPPQVSFDPAETLAVLQYTGGTTGTPKAAMLTHRNIVANAVQSGIWCCDAGGMKAGEERVITVLPLFHVFAMTVGMNMPIHKAMEIILLPKFELKQLVKAIAKTRPTLMPGVPTLFNAMANAQGVKPGSLASLNVCVSGGAPLPAEVKERFERRTGCTLVEGYGLSETSPVSHCNPLIGENRAGSVGLPLPATRTAICDLEQPGRWLPPGERGIICIAGPQVMKGYWNRPDETAKVMHGEWLLTGDIGMMDEAGYTYVVDRQKEMVICNGFNVYPRQVEEAIYYHPAVLEAAVIGVPDDRKGQCVKAFIVLRPGENASSSDITAFLKDRIARYAIPSVIEFRESLPKSPVGKILKRELH